MKEYTYDICQPYDSAAGIIGFNDTVTITVESGDPGGDESGEYSFKEFMLQSLREWYYEAGVKLQEEEK